MAFFKFRQRGQPQPEPTRGRGRKNEPAAPGPQETIDTLRRRARHRLIGAAVLVGLAIIGFPLLFDTQPRPVAVNAPITIPDKDKVAPLRTPDPVPAAASLGEREEMVSGAVAPRGGERTASASAAAVAP
ncbi:MAG TPA: SPOR domain-containing protein, partial [Ottowia sp.]|nr:SPOR domain-containing protein [Ottowia sp.]